MPWNWQPRPSQDVAIGGNKGTVQEAERVKTWPGYSAAYLAKRLGSDHPTSAYTDKYRGGKDINGNTQDVTDGMDAASKAVYLERITKNYENEADECLKREFIDWLQGTHEDNKHMRPYTNAPGKPERRVVYGASKGPGGGSGKVTGEALDGWTPTWWGQTSLTYLDGVRDFLRGDTVRAAEHNFAMNLLAEHGPQNIEQAWAYFKHWVKGRPLSEAEGQCLHKSGELHDGVDRAPLGPIKPDRMHFGGTRVPVPDTPKVLKPTAEDLQAATEGRVAHAHNIDYLQDTDPSASYEPYDAFGNLNLRGLDLSGFELPDRPRWKNWANVTPKRQQAAERAAELEHLVPQLEGTEPLDPDTTPQSLRGEVRALTDATGEPQWLSEADDRLREIEASGQSRLSRIVHALTPGPVAGQVAGATYAATRAGVATGARLVEQGANLITSAMTREEEEADEYYLTADQAIEDQTRALLAPAGWQAAGFPLESQRRRAP